MEKKELPRNDEVFLNVGRNRSNSKLHEKVEDYPQKTVLGASTKLRRGT